MVNTLRVHKDLEALSGLHIADFHRGTRWVFL
ncbi:hypothetical protein L915_21008 [Phytophthora nicotianae]|uniref:Uncharacterized protein n=1 Tax=Phytophthora nicotianae TaxID=4792 RepID=W2M5S9_PHYNI|nr:hypothetical protein L915_21008 [Phytophthora nicotianae]ETM31731.1 hypothetical protein L914_20749 [Phytophthora nicotianae]